MFSSRNGPFVNDFRSIPNVDSNVFQFKCIKNGCKSKYKSQENLKRHQDVVHQVPEECPHCGMSVKPAYLVFHYRACNHPLENRDYKRNHRMIQTQDKIEITQDEVINQNENKILKVENQSQDEIQNQLHDMAESLPFPNLMDMDDVESFDVPFNEAYCDEDLLPSATLPAELLLRKKECVNCLKFVSKSNYKRHLKICMEKNFC